MGVGQHYLQAAWVGKHFGYKDEKNEHLSEEEKGDIRNYVLPLIYLKDLYKFDTINEEKLNNLVKPRPVRKIYTSGAIISREIEDKIKINGLTIGNMEGNSKYIQYLIDDFEGDTFKYLKKIIPFIALQESRNISLFLEYSDMLKKIISGPLEIDENLIKNNLKYSIFMENNYLKKLVEDINIIKKKKESVYSISTDIYNNIYPKLIEFQIRQYEKYEWIKIKIQDGDTLGLSDKPVINFSIQNMKLEQANFLVFDLLPDIYKKIINQSTLCLLSKNFILIGFDKKHNFLERLDVNHFIYTIYDFIALVFFQHSYNFYSFSSEKNKKIIFDLIIKNFSSLKFKYASIEHYVKRS